MPDTQVTGAPPQTKKKPEPKAPSMGADPLVDPLKESELKTAEISGDRSAYTSSVEDAKGKVTEVGTGTKKENKEKAEFSNQKGLKGKWDGADSKVGYKSSNPKGPAIESGGGAFTYKQNGVKVKAGDGKLGISKGNESLALKGGSAKYTISEDARKKGKFEGTQASKSFGLDSKNGISFSKTDGKQLKTKDKSSGYGGNIGPKGANFSFQKNGKGGNVGYDWKEKQLNMGMKTSSGFQATLGVKKDGFDVGLGNKKFGGNLGVGWGEDEINVKAGGYFRGIGLNGGYHGVYDRKDEKTGFNDVMGGNAKEKGLTNETGWSAGGGAYFVDGGYSSISGTRNSYMSSKDLSAKDEKRLSTVTKAGQQNANFNYLKKGEGVSWSKTEGHDWNVNGNAVEIASGGYEGGKTTNTSSTMAKRDDGTLAAQNVKTEQDRDKANWGVVGGLYSGSWENKETITTGLTLIGPDGKKVVADNLQKFIRLGIDPSIAENAKVGQVVMGMRIESKFKITNDQTTNDHSLGYGLLGYQGTTTTNKGTQSQLTHGGKGASTLKTNDEDYKNKWNVTVLGGGTTSSKTDHTQNSFVTGKSGTQADFNRLQKMSDGGVNSAKLSNMKSGDQLQYDKSKNEKSKTDADLAWGLGGNSIETGSGKWSSTQINKTDKGASVTQATGSDAKFATENGVGWGLYKDNASVKAETSAQITLGAGNDNADATKTLETFSKSGLLTPGDLKGIQLVDQKIAQYKAIYAKQSKAKQPTAATVKTLTALRAQRANLIEQANKTAATRAKPGQKLANGVVVQSVSSETKNVKTNNSSVAWGLSSSSSLDASQTKKQSSLGTDGKVKTSESYSAIKSNTSGSVTKTNAFASKVITTPGGNSISLTQANGASVGGEAIGVKTSAAIHESDLKAIAARYNTGEKAEAFWKRQAAQAAATAKDPNVKAAFAKIKGPAGFQAMSPAMQKAFVDCLLRDISDANPFEAIAAVELMKGQDVQGEVYAAMMKKIHGKAKDGDVASIYAKFVSSQDPKTKAQLAKQAKVTNTKS